MIRIGLLGCGYVGGGVCTLLARNRRAIEQRSGLRLVVERVLVRDPAKARKGADGSDLPVDRKILTGSADEILEDPGIDIVVEAMGGLDPAESYVRRALEAGKPVATANKALISEKGEELSALARSRDLSLEVEASVCGAIPIVAALKHDLGADVVHALDGVVNASCNFILSGMETGLPYDEALAEATSAGYTEADPSLDVDGIDAAQKLSILAWLAFGERLRWQEIPRTGIRGLGLGAVQAARARGKVLRSVVRAERTANRKLLASVGLLELPPEDPLAALRGEQNGVRLRLAGAQTLFFSGPGAGALPTASALLADVVRIAKRERTVTQLPIL